MSASLYVPLAGLDGLMQHIYKRQQCTTGYPTSLLYTGLDSIQRVLKSGLDGRALNLGRKREGEVVPKCVSELHIRGDISRVYAKDSAWSVNKF